VDDGDGKEQSAEWNPKSNGMKKKATDLKEVEKGDEEKSYREGKDGERENKARERETCLHPSGKENMEETGFTWETKNELREKGIDYISAKVGYFTAASRKGRLRANRSALAETQKSSESGVRTEKEKQADCIYKSKKRGGSSSKELAYRGTYSRIKRRGRKRERWGKRGSGNKSSSERVRKTRARMKLRLRQNVPFHVVTRIFREKTSRGAAHCFPTREN